ASALSRGYSASVNARGATTAGLTDSEQEGSPVPNSSETSKWGRTTRGTRTGPRRTKHLGSRSGGASGAGEYSAGAQGPNLSHWSTLKSGDSRYGGVGFVQGTGIDKTFRVSIDGYEFHIDSDDIRKAFGLGESDNPNVDYLTWPLVLSQFLSKAEMEQELLVTGKKNGPYLRRKNLSPALCLFHMVAHRNIIPQKGNKNVLVGNMFYLVYLYAKCLNIDLVLIIMYKMFTTTNLDHQTQTLPYNRFISQLLTDVGYVIPPDEEVDAKNEVINAWY
ncbi:hypothetical protein GIB67_019165, partial [Kingdonia uniflora]